MNLLLTVLLIISSGLVQHSNLTLNLSNVKYQIVGFADTPTLEFNLTGTGTSSALVRVCEASGCNESIPATILFSNTFNFNQAGVNVIEFIKFSKTNETRRVMITYNSHGGATNNLNFNVISAAPKSYTIVSTTLNKVVKETDSFIISPSNQLTTIYNNFDFRHYFQAVNQDRVINFNNFMIKNDGKYYQVGGFMQLNHGFEQTPYQKVGSFYQFPITSVNTNDEILPVLVGAYYNLQTQEMTNQLGEHTINTNNLIVSNNYNKSLTNNLIFNFRNVGPHKSSIKVTVALKINNQIFGSCDQAMVCVIKKDVKPLTYTKSKIIP
jgi:hypothetical protein